MAAFRFPNLFRRVIAEGAFSAAFIPVYGNVYTKNGKEQADLFTGNILSIFGLWVFIVVVACQILMPYLIYIISPGFSEDFILYAKNLFSTVISGQTLPVMPDLSGNDKISMTVSLTIICLPYAGCMFLVGLMSGLLNYHHKFAVPASVPALLNTVLCIGLTGGVYMGFNPLYSLGFAVCVAGVLQVLWLYYFIRKMDIGLRFGSLTPNVHMQKFKSLFWSGFISGGVIQINILIGSMIASFQDGAMSYLYYADRVYQLPLSIVGTTLALVLLPSLVRKIAEDNFDSARDLMARATEFAAFLTLPACMAMIFIPHEITSLLFERGVFTADDTYKTACVLIFYGFGLPAFILIKLYEPGFYARHDTKTPMKFATASILVNIICSFSLFPFMGFYAIALATVIASWQNALCLLWTLHKHKIVMIDSDLKTRLLKSLVACGVMMAVILLFQNYIYHIVDGHIKLKYIATIIVGIISYFIMTHILVMFPRGSVSTYLKRKKN